MVLLRSKLRAQVRKGPDKKTKVDFDGDRIVVGTHPSCDLVLTDKTVSRQHCEIILSRRGYLLRDLDSTNGTRIGDLRVGEVGFRTSVVADIGASQVSFSRIDDQVEVTLPADTHFGPLVGRSAAMRRVFELLSRVAPSEASILISGESGTGKEVCARSIHEASPRANGPFVVVDCGALPTNLIESELYGHVKGAFTGATQDRPGAFRSANGGTLFLDEIGELPVDLQTRLLGALERREVHPLGQPKSVPIDVRVVAATNRDLRKEVNAGSFREDLYFRLAVVPVVMPPLRDRTEDIPLYVAGFLEELGAQGRFELDPNTLSALESQPWRGNVRELRNVIERAVALGSVDIADQQPRPVPATTTAKADSVPVAASVDVEIPFKTGKQALIEDYERAYVTALMAKFDDNITQAARGAQIDRVYLLRVLDKYGLRPTKRK